jgi:16S rRNA (cytidine1402-2'-O)-methyltransferase
MSKLYIVATPIGNLGDMTFRAVETLKSVDLILSEDTRVTRNLLNHFEIDKPTDSFHRKSNPQKVAKIIEKLQNGQDLALVSDAGTPGLSDPGNELISRVWELLGDEVDVISIPGPSSLTSLISVSGLNMTKFQFWGFTPQKKGRNKFFGKLLESEIPVVFFESPHRLMKNLNLLQELSQEQGIEPNLVVGRELTKMFEQIRRGNVSEILEYFEENSDKVKGEFVIIAENKN